MITEDFVSYEVAKLLKEKGFDGECDYLYANGEILRAQGFKCNWNKGESIFTDYKNECSAPTLQMAMKWLREVHHLHIIPEISDVSRLNPQYYVVIWLTTPKRESYMLELFDSYEEAVEEGIKYCLENLI